jgi:hypothetical protein
MFKRITLMRILKYSIYTILIVFVSLIIVQIGIKYRIAALGKNAYAFLKSAEFRKDRVYFEVIGVGNVGGLYLINDPSCSLEQYCNRPSLNYQGVSGSFIKIYGKDYEMIYGMSRVDYLPNIHSTTIPSIIRWSEFSITDRIPDSVISTIRKGHVYAAHIWFGGSISIQKLIINVSNSAQVK